MVQPVECKQTDTQTDTQTDRRTLPKILPLPLTREVIKALIQARFCLLIRHRTVEKAHPHSEGELMSDMQMEIRA